MAEKVIKTLREYARNCSLCPRQCRINRQKEEKGFCQAGYLPLVYTYFLHQGEEPILCGQKGSGTIFFSGCSLRCIYCQNYQFSHFLKGKETTPRDLAAIMLKLQAEGAANINLVTPTHFLAPISEAIALAKKKGLKLPLVYNTSGYERTKIIELVGEIADIYLVDLRYVSPVTSQAYSQAPNYPSFAKKAILEMVRQKPKILANGLLKQGVIIRILVLPNYENEAIKALKWLKNNNLISKAYLSLMSQYRPYFKAKNHPIIGRNLKKEEYQKVVDFALSLNPQGWIQENPQEELAGVYFKPRKGL